MTLLNDFFTIRQLQSDEGEIHALLEINAKHAILEGHFPGFPVMPGVCMMQIVREVFECATGMAVRIVQGDNIKFLAVLNPGQHPDVKLNISHEETSPDHIILADLVSVQNEPTSGLPVTFFKFKGLYREESSFVQ